MEHEDERLPCADVVARLRAAGYKITPPRLAVLEVIEQEGEHLNPNEILAQARAIHPALGRATVYRFLELLTQLGWCARSMWVKAALPIFAPMATTTIWSAHAVALSLILTSALLTR